MSTIAQRTRWKLAGTLFLRREVLTAVLASVALFFTAGHAMAQQKHKYFFKTPPGTTKIVQTHQLDVGDVPGHQMRIAEIVSKYGDDAPVLDGVKVRESRGVLASDYFSGTGNAFVHAVWTLETGDKVFALTDVMARTTFGEDGGRKTTFNAVVKLSGGTGKFKGIRGTLWTTGFSDLKSKISGSQTEGEYWFEQ